MKSKNIIVTGDPIIDIYVSNVEGTTVSYEERSGGALNVFDNVNSILKKELNKYSTKSIFAPDLKYKSQPYYKILRLNDLKDIHLCKTSNKKDFYEHNFLSLRNIEILLNQSTKDSVIIFSDYNKGILNRPFSNLRYASYKIDLGVVDSKHRSINLDYLKVVEKSILRCTGSEYCPKFAKNFTYTIWTDAEKPIKILDSCQNILKEIEFEPMPAVDTCGAGDTFTAAVASYFYKNGTNLTLSEITNAVDFAILCSQEVVQIPKTSITTQVLK